MPTPITLTEPENRFLQECFIEMYQNDNNRSIEGPLLHSILAKLETWPTDVTFTGQENSRLQVFLEVSNEVITPLFCPNSPVTFLPDQTQSNLVQSIMVKIKASA